MKNWRMNEGFWLPIVWRMPSDDGDCRPLQLQRHKRDAVDVEHDVGALGVLARHGDFLG